MDTKANAKQAMKELFGLSREASSHAHEEKTPCEAPEKAAPQPCRATASQTPTVIGTDVQLTGDIVSKSAIEVYGTVHGNITTTDSIKVCGKIIGNVRANGVILLGCKIKGDVFSGTLLTMDSTSVVDGMLQGENLSIDGRIRGNLTAGNLIDLKPHALVLGDVHAVRFGMSDGTRLIGNVHLSCPGGQDEKDLEQEFSI